MKKLIQILALSLLIAFNASAQQWGMYTLYATKGGTAAYLIDTNSTVYKTWTFPSNKKSAYSAYLIPGDTLVRSYEYTSSGGLHVGGGTGAVQKVSWDGTVVWDYQYNSSSYTLHHDICPMPNGNVLMIALEKKSTTEATQAGASSNTTIYAEKLMEVHPTGATTGTVVWEWHLWDHLCQNYNPSKDNYVTSISDNPQLMNINYSSSQDRWHLNGIDYNEDLDQIVISMHYMDEAYIIDHSTTTAEAAGHTGGNSGKGGDFLYRWGNPSAYGLTGTTFFDVIHDAHWISSDHPTYPNYLCAYNNKGGTGGKTAITIWNPPYNGYNYTHTAGQTYGPSSYAYQYNSSFTAQSEGNSQQLPNGNMMVNNSFGTSYEISSSNAILWSKNTSSSHVYRYSKCYVRGPMASCTASSTQVQAGTSITLDASAVSLTETSPTYSYEWTSVPAGFTSSSPSPSVTPTGTTTYTVVITNTILGCSDEASVTVDVITGMNEISHIDMEIYPNPSNNIFNIKPSSGNSNYLAVVFDALGRTIISENNINSINLNDYNTGLYFVSFTFENGEKIIKKISLIK